MKKIFSLIFLQIITLGVSAQWFGDGLSAGSAYYGVINTSNPMQTWNTANYPGGVIFVGRSTAGQNDLEVASGGNLTISQGIIVKFCTTVSDLKITGTGILNAAGSSSSYITFTKNAQATWGHISFEASTGVSVIQYCIIKDGSKTGAGIEGYGGGIHANTSSLTISDCTIQDNFAQWGGGIFVNKNQNPTITNCIIRNNTAAFGGGGLYFWNGSYSVVTNCLVFSNTVTSTTIYGGGGILFGPATGSVKVINCTFAYNTAGFSANEILFYSSPNARVINSILWGTNTPYYGQTSSSFAYCGIQGGYPSGSVGCINLNSDNSNAAGPNFNSINGTDWSLRFISPCRDAGTTPSPTVPTDYLGNSRIGPYDIGAYEVQYSRWKTNPADIYSWTNAGNWEQGLYPGLGGTTGDVVIPLLSSSSVAPDISGSITVSSGKFLIMNPGAKATFGTLTNSGTVKLESDATNISSLIAGTYSGNAAIVELYLTGGEAGTRNYRWHYISTPVSTLPVSTFTTVTPDIVRFWDNRVTTDLVQGWVAQDGYVYATGQYIGPTFTSLTPGLGYDYYSSTNNKFTFSGQLNTADVGMTLDYAGGPNNGFNLLGNPFSSGLDWDYINTHRFPSNTSKSVFFTRDNALCSYIAGVGSPLGVNGFIPPMQGFFTKTYATGKTIWLAESAKTHTLHARYKGVEIIPLVRLFLTDDTLSDETVVRFDTKASAGLDNDFDALKIFLSNENTSIYSAVSGSNYVINGQPFPDPTVEIPIVINLLATGNHTITTTQLQGLDGYYVYLIDNVTGFTANLKTTPTISFTASAGLIPDRFILRITTLLTGTEDPVVTKNTFNIYPATDYINIQTLADEWDGKSGSVNVMDLAGKTVSTIQNAEFSKNSAIQVQAPATKGLYMVKLRSGMKRYVGKVVIR